MLSKVRRHQKDHHPNSSSKQKKNLHLPLSVTNGMIEEFDLVPECRNRSVFFFSKEKSDELDTGTRFSSGYDWVARRKSREGDCKG
jgi:hypothetical protein